MKKITRKTFSIFIFIICLPIAISFAPSTRAYISSGHIGLLTVIETQSGNDTNNGGVANLGLSIKPGTGRIFIDSFPLSKIDTQVTTRFANEIACDFLDMDCSHYDFFYTIKADSAIVGGPSAGAATTVLTIALLDNQKIDDNTVMTGTINSGNLVGPVAGISAKTLAAQKYGFTKALIPKWDIVNETPDKNLTINIVPVSTLEQALYEFTGKNYTKTHKEIIPSQEYTDIMKQVTKELCSKYGSEANGTVYMPNLTQIIPNDNQYAYENNYENTNGTTINASKINISSGNSVRSTNNSKRIATSTSTNSINLTNTSMRKDFFSLAVDAINKKDYYSAASYCFGGDVKITTYLMKNFTDVELKSHYYELKSRISKAQSDLTYRSENFSTISEIETYMIVMERLQESQKIVDSVSFQNISYTDLAYATERFNTAQVWSRFFDVSGKKAVLDKDSLINVCNKKLGEVEERINYLEYYFPKDIDRTELDQAYTYYNNKDYLMCIFTASKAKADIDVVLSALFVNEPNINMLLSEKITAAGNAVAIQEDKGVFPILGYSYYEYANSLRYTDKYSALLYSEYAMELSNLNMYFPLNKNSMPQVHFNIDPSIKYSFIAGVLFGLLIAILFFMNKNNSHAKNTSHSNTPITASKSISQNLFQNTSKKIKTKAKKSRTKIK